MSETMDSTSDQRVVNNIMRHEYRVLTDDEKAQMQTLKDIGLLFVHLLYDIGGNGADKHFTGAAHTSHELALAQTKIEEAVMWAVKHITR
ncbi:MAG: hypothetical protein AB7I42_25905 [Bradyrhizobium sp.]|uniref:Acb2/Tad1 domain-containing protein n=1 Tax=Bradyrhizobium sp. TaxID=376 RepID=UPI003D10B17C